MPPPLTASGCAAAQVKIIAGKDKGQTGTIARVLRDQNRVIVEGYNLVRSGCPPRRAGGGGVLMHAHFAFHGGR